MAKAVQDLTIEELRRLVLKQARQLEQREQQLRQSEDKVTLLTRENHWHWSIHALVKDFSESLQNDCKKYFELDEPLPPEVMQSAVTVIAEYRKALLGNKLYRMHFEKGNESFKPNARNSIDVTPEERIKQEIVETETAMSRCIKGLTQASAKCEEEVSSSDKKNVKAEDVGLKAAMAYLGNKPPRVMMEKEPRAALQGRQANKANLPVKQVPAPEAREITHCKECGNETIVDAEQLERLKTTKERLVNLCEEKVSCYKMVVCTACNRVHVQMSEGVTPPVLPNQTVAQDVLIETFNLMCNGVPANRVESIWLKTLCLGSDTLSRLLLDYRRYYAKPLTQALLNAVKKTRVLIADKTTYDCLASEGLGSSLPAEKTHSQSYVLALSSVAAEDTPFVSYRYMPSRSSESIRLILDKTQMQPEVLVSDGYGAYPGIAAEQLEAAHQTCMVHFRREILKALDYKKYQKEFKKLNDKQIEAYWYGKLKNGENITAKLMTVNQMISDIYHWENLIKRDTNEPLESYYARVQTNRQKNVQPIMDELDVVMRSMTDGAVEQRKGKYVALKEGLAHVRAVVYYMNQRSSLRYFLQDPRVPCDTNVVERAIRPLTILRKNAYFAQSVEGMEKLCDIFTLYETARVNGVDFVQWLEDYDRALFKHCYEGGWTKELRQNPGKDLNKKIMKWDFEALAEGFNFDEWLPWNYKKRTT